MGVAHPGALPVRYTGQKLRAFSTLRETSGVASSLFAGVYSNHTNVTHHSAHKYNHVELG